MEELTYQAVVGATVLEMVILVFWGAAGSLLTMIGFWGLLRRVKALESKPGASPMMTVNNPGVTVSQTFNQGELFDADAVAQGLIEQLRETYTQEYATAIVRAFRPGGYEYERLERARPSTEALQKTAGMQVLGPVGWQRS